MRFHLIDRIEQIAYGRYIEAVKCVTLADDVFDEHFPGFPVFPGSLILEGLAQLGGAFFEIMMKQKGVPVKRAVLVLVQQLKFKRPVTPGDKRCSACWVSLLFSNAAGRKSGCSWRSSGLHTPRT